MALTIYEDKSGDHEGNRVVATERLWVDDAHTKLVPDGDPEAAYLFCNAGQSVLRDEFKALGGKIRSAPKTAKPKAEKPAAAKAKTTKTTKTKATKKKS